MATKAAKKTATKAVTKKAIKSVPKQPTKLKVIKTQFKYFAPEAAEVCLAGTFNQWLDKDLFLKKDKTGYWKISVPLGEGRYEYRYVVDGNWTNAQDQVECVPNSFGTWNTVLQIQN